VIAYSTLQEKKKIMKKKKVFKVNRKYINKMEMKEQLLYEIIHPNKEFLGITKFNYDRET
jgi:hypothetical protein